MPELPEVETVVRSLRPRLTGREILAITCHFPGVLLWGKGLKAQDIVGQRVLGLRRRGKLAMIDLEGDAVMSVHLRMTGHLSVVGAESELPKHTHVVVRLDGTDELRFTDPRRFGRVEVRARKEMDATPFLRRLGPEPSEMEAEDLAARLGRRRGSIKGALLDQGLVAGLGNIYVDEILFATGVHPAHPADRLRRERIDRLAEAMRDVMAAAIAGGGSTISDYRNPDGQPGGYQFAHQVFGREGHDCRSCGATIRKTRLVGRGTHWCPQCQPRPRLRPRRGKRGTTTG